MESVNTKPENKTAASEEPKAKEQNDIAKENVAKSNNGNSIEATQEEGPSLKEVIKKNATEEESSVACMPEPIRGSRCVLMPDLTRSNMEPL